MFVFGYIGMIANKTQKMELINLNIDRVIIHEVYKRANDGRKIEPNYGSEIEALDLDGTDALRERIIAAMSSPTRSMQMTVSRVRPDDMISVVAGLADADVPLYISQSKKVADLLADAQKSRGLPGGIVVLFVGTAGVPEKRLVGVIKAEVHTGFTRQENDGRVALKFLKNLLLTPQTKLYKIGLFIHHSPEAGADLAAAWSATIYDETMTVANRYGAAQYFYDGFLGCTFPESSARQTKEFHDLTKNFIKGMSVPEEEKVILHNALVTYLKADQTPTVGSPDFGQSYFSEGEIRDAYIQHMTAAGFPNTAVNKDTSDVDGSLRLRRLIFRNKVRVTGPAEGFDKLVEFESIDGPRTDDGSVPKWTRLTIKDRIATQE